MNYQRFAELGTKIKGGTATKEEKDEYMLLLYQNGSITQQQYQEYLNRKNDSNENLKGALAIGAILLLIYLLSDKTK
jgi:hypothetical protein